MIIGFKQTESINVDTRNAVFDDIDPIVSIHIRAFTNFFLTFLGPGFLKILYSAILQDPSGIFFVVADNNTIVGFVAGTVRPFNFYSRLLRKDWWRFGLAASKALLNRPTILPRLLRAFKKPQEEDPNDSYATVMSIAVDPDCENRGLGKVLVEAFVTEAKQRDVRKINLTTDAEHNEKVNHFYRSLGFDISRVLTTPEGRVLNEYCLYL